MRVWDMCSNQEQNKGDSGWKFSDPTHVWPLMNEPEEAAPDGAVAGATAAAGGGVLLHPSLTPPSPSMVGGGPGSCAWATIGGCEAVVGGWCGGEGEASNPSCRPASAPPFCCRIEAGPCPSSSSLSEPSSSEYPSPKRFAPSSPSSSSPPPMPGSAAP